MLPEISELDATKLELLVLKRDNAAKALTDFALTVYQAAQLDPKEYSLDYVNRKFTKIIVNE